MESTFMHHASTSRNRRGTAIDLRSPFQPIPSGDGPAVPPPRLPRRTLRRLLLHSMQVFVASCSLLHPPVYSHSADTLTPDLAAELAHQVVAGGVILLGPGTYVKSESWVLDQTLTIIGAGKEATVLLFERADDDSHSAITWRGEGRLTLRRLHIVYMGQGPADVLSAKAGVIELGDVVVTGGWAGDADTEVGSGLVLTREAQARVLRSV